MVGFSTNFLPSVGVKFGPVLGTRRSTLCIELSRPELVATVVANDLLVTTLSAITQGSTIATPVQHLTARLRALARSSATIRDSLGTLDSHFNRSQ